VEFLEGRVVPALFTWTGASLNSADWSDGANWQGGVAPTGAAAQDESLLFPAIALQQTNVNDIVAGVFDQLQFENNYTVSGNAMTLGDTTNDGVILAGVDTPAAQITLLTPITIAAGKELQFNLLGTTTATLSGAASIAGDSTSSIAKLGTGQLDLQVASIGFAGPIDLQAGVVNATVDGALGTADAGTTVEAGATLNFGSSVPPLNYLTPEVLTLNGGTVDTSTNTNFYGSIVQTASSTIQTQGGYLTINGPVDLGGAELVLHTTFNNYLIFGAPIGDSVGTGSVTVAGDPGSYVYYAAPAANTYTGTTTVNSGYLALLSGTPNGAIVGDLVINGGAVVNLADEQILDSVDVTVNAGGTLYLAGFTETLDPLTLNGGVVDLAGGFLILSGNVVTGGLGTQSSILDTIGGGNLDLGGATRSFTVAATDTLFVAVPITGVGGLNADGAGTLELDALFANTYDGDTNVSGGGTLVLNSVQGPAVPGNLTATGIGTVVSVRLPEQIGDTSDVVIDDAATLNIGFIPAPGTTETIGTLNLTAGTVQVGDGGLLTIANGGLNGTVDSTVTLIGTGTLVANGSGLFAGQILGGGTFDSQGPGVQIITGIIAPSIDTIVSGGVLQDDGNIQGPVTVHDGATLGGSGKVQGLVTVLGGGTIDPGPAGGGTGILNTAGGVTYAPVTPTSTFHVDLEGLTPGTEYDQIQVSFQPVVLNGAQLSISGAFCAPNGSQFTIIAGASGITGNFKFGNITLTEGMTFDIGGNTRFKITYVGGAGHHDVILTRVFVIDIWTGASKTSNLWSDPMNWAKKTVPNEGDLLQFPASGLRKFSVNDLPVGFRVGEINFLGGAYNLSGNGIQLGSGVQNLGAPTLNVISFDITLNCNTVWNNTGAAFIDSGNINLGSFRLTINTFSPATTTKLSGAITGTGGVTKVGQGTLIYAGTASNTYAGVTHVSAGTLSLQKTNPAIAVPSTLIVGNGVGALLPTTATVFIAYNDQIADTAPIVINRDGFLNFGTSKDKVGNLIFNGGKINVGAISGAIQLTGDIIANVNTTIANKIDLGSTHHVFFTAPGVTLNIASQIFGVGGSLTVAGTGAVVMSGNTENLYTGTTFVASGTLVLSKSAGANSIYGPLVVGDGFNVATVIYSAANQIKNNQPITVNAFSAVLMNGFSDEVGALNLNDGVIVIDAGTLTINGNITATGNSAIFGGTLYIKEVSRIVNVAAPTDRLDIFANVTSIFNAGLIKTGDGTLALHGSGPAGPLNVTTGTTVVDVGSTANSASVSDTGTLVVAGQITGPVTIAPDGILELAGGSVAGPITTTGGSIQGSGVINGGSFSAVVIAPGTPTMVGTITTSKEVALDPASTYVAKLGSIANVLVSDLLEQNGGSEGIDLGNSSLNIALLSGYIPTVGDMFTIVSSPVLGILGQFANATDGSVLVVGANLFQINYVLDPSFTFVVGITLTCVA
jgi:autotransporter-associated beta strand protein